MARGYEGKISSHVRISYRFYRFATTRYTTDFYKINRGYYTMARGYEFYVLVVRTISHSFAALTREILGTFSNDDENVNVTDRKSGKRTLMLPRMPNLARLVVRTPFATICRLVENVSMFYLFSNFYLGILGISSI